MADFGIEFELSNGVMKDDDMASVTASTAKTRLGRRNRKGRARGIFASRYGGPLRPPRLPDIGPVIALVIFAVMLSAFVPFIIDWLRPGKADKPADSKDEPPKASDKLGKCPKCGEELEPQFEACWKCGTVRKPDGEHPA
jgi:hypothetical protein